VSEIKPSLAAFKRWMIIAAPESFKRRPYVAAWIKGDIYDELYLECNREWMLAHGMIKLSGSWWPADITKRGAVIEDGEIRIRCVKVEYPDPDNPRKKKEVLEPHPLWRKYMRELLEKDRAGAYTEHIAEDEYRLPYKEEE
jgi:hypothetical protein